MRRMHLLIVAGLVGASVSAAAATPPRRAVIEERLERLRGVTPCQGAAECARVGAELDAITDWLAQHGAAAGPIAARMLGAEVARPHPDQRLLVEVGGLLMRIDPDRHAGLAMKALGRVDPTSPMLKAHWDDLFRMAHALARRGQPDLPRQLDRIFIGTREHVVLMPEGLRLDGAQMSLYLYGAWSPTVEDHLVQLARRPEHARRALWLLTRLGSSACTNTVLDLVRSHPDDAMVAQAAAFFLRVGGTPGRQALATMEEAATRTDERLRPLWVRARAEAELGPGASPTSPLRSLPAQETLGTSEALAAALTGDVASGGTRFALHARAVAAEKPTEALMERLRLVRSRMLHRVSDDAIRDVDLINEVLNTLQLRMSRAAG